MRKEANLKNDRGQGLIEYLIIVAIVGVATMGIIRILGQTLSAKFTSVTYALQGRSKSVAPSEIRETHYKQKDLSDFFQGAGQK